MAIQYDGTSKVLRRICQLLNVSSSVVTLAANSWAYSATYGTLAQTVSVSWMSADLDIEVAPVLPDAKTDREAVLEARVSCVAVGTGTLTFISDADSAPSSDISMIVKQLL